MIKIFFQIHSSIIDNLMTEPDIAIAENEQSKLTLNQSVYLAESSARRNEWKHYAKVIDKFKSKSLSMSGQMTH